MSDAKHLQSFDYLLHEPHEVFTKQLYFTPSLLATFLLGSFDHHHHLLEANDHLGNFGPEFARAVLIARVIHKHMPFKEYQDVEVGKLLSALFRLADRGQRKILLQGFSLLVSFYIDFFCILNFYSLSFLSCQRGFKNLFL